MWRVLHQSWDRWARDRSKHTWYKPSKLTKALPKDVRPNTVIKVAGQYQVESIAGPSGAATAVPMTVQTTIDALPLSKSWAIYDWKISPEGARSIANAIKNKTAKGVSDGSYKNEAITAAFILTTHDGSSESIGRNIPPGTRLDATPYRAELSGICGMLTAIQTLARSTRSKREALNLPLTAK